MRRRDRNVWAGVILCAVVLAGAVWFAPVEFADSVRLPGKVYAGSVWTLERSGQGTLNARVDDREGGVSSSYLIQSIDRGDVARFELLPSVRVGARIEPGDTIGVLVSAVSDRELAELSSAVSVAASEAAVLGTGAKQALIDAASARLEAAKTQWDLQKRIVARIRQLADAGMVSTDELERAETQEVALEGDVATLTADLEVLRTGERPSERQLGAARLEASRRQLEALARQRGAFAVRVAHGGVVSRPAGDSVLVRITDTSRWVAIVPVPLERRDVFAEGAQVTLEGTEPPVMGKVSHLDQTVHQVGGRASLLATVVLQDAPAEALDGLVVEAVGQTAPIRLRDRVLSSFSGLFRWRTWLSNAPRV